MDMATVWDQAIESAQQKASTTESEPSTTCTLKLVAKVNPRLLPDEVRSADLIAAPLRLAIRECVAGRSPWPLFVWSKEPGVGKTCAALALSDHVEGESMYYTADSWVRSCVSADKGKLEWKNSEGGSGTYSLPSFLRHVGRVALVILDELRARETVQDWYYEHMRSVIDARKRKPFIILSNYTVQQLGSAYDDPFASRLVSGTVVGLTGADRRVKK